jgi:aquaporin NIP
MNPARSLAPAVMSLQLGSLWVYLSAPVLGAVGAVAACRCVQDKGCCKTASQNPCA